MDLLLISELELSSVLCFLAVEISLEQMAPRELVCLISFEMVPFAQFDFADPLNNPLPEVSMMAQCVGRWLN